MKLKLYQVDAFAEKPFEGNPAAVVPLNKWLPDQILQKIAEENNLAETAYYISKTDGFEIRWFTPGTEVKLCGHATLASAAVLFNEFDYCQGTASPRQPKKFEQKHPRCAGRTPIRTRACPSSFCKGPPGTG